MAERGSAYMNAAAVICLDSSVFFTAVNSPTGSSAKIFSLAGEKFKLVAPRLVFVETERNVRKKLSNDHLRRFLNLAKKVELLDSFPNERRIKKAAAVIVQKDAPILSEAKQARTDYLLTLDRKHFHTSAVEKFLKPTKVVTPRQLLLGFGEASSSVS